MMESSDNNRLSALVKIDGNDQLPWKIRDNTFLEHFSREPCLFMGDGQFEFTEHEGHFRIKDLDEQQIRRWPMLAIPGADNETSENQNRSEFRIDLRGSFQSTDKTSENEKVMRMTVKRLAHLLQTTADSGNLSTTTPLHKLVIRLDNATKSSASQYQRVWLRLPFSSDDHFYGAGEQFTHFDLRGHKFPIWTREQGVGRDPSHPLWTAAEHFGTGYGGDYHTTYFPQASFVSASGVYFFISDHFEAIGEKHEDCGTFYSELDFSAFENIRSTSADAPTSTSYVEVMMYGKLPFECTLLFADSCAQAVQAFTSLFDVPLKIPAWVHEGAILGLQGGTNEVEAIVQKLLNAGGAVRGLWIQDWCGKFNTSFGQRLFWNWVWDPERYPQIHELVERLRTLHNVRTLGYASPHLRRDASLFKEAEQRKFLVLDGETEQPLIQDFGEFFCGTVDLTKNEACEWFRDTLHTNMVDTVGLSGWMADFSEYIPAHARFSNGMSGIEAHNRFPVMWAKLNHDIMNKDDKFDEYLYWMRAGGLGSQRYMQMLWAGDQCQSFEPKTDGLASVLPAFLSAGVSGVGVNHFDVGLFTGFDAPPEGEIGPCLRTKELLLRSAELATFTPVFRTHEGNRPQLSHQFYSDEATLKTFVLYTRAHAVLAPYHKYVIEQRGTQFLPVFRPMVFFLQRAQEHVPAAVESAWNSDVVEACLTVQDQYGYGDLLLVAPVVEENATTRRVLLPPLADNRRWMHFPTNTRYDGAQWVAVEARLGEPPVFVDADHAYAERFLEVFNQLAVIFRRISASNQNQ